MKNSLFLSISNSFLFEKFALQFSTKMLSFRISFVIGRRQATRSFSRHNSWSFSMSLCFTCAISLQTQDSNGFKSEGQWSLPMNEGKFLAQHFWDFSWMWAFVPSPNMSFCHDWKHLLNDRACHS